MLITATSEHLQSGRRETKRRARGNEKSPRTPRGGAGALSQKDTRRVAAFRGAGSHHVAHVRPLPRPGPRFSCDPARHTTATIKRMFPRAEWLTAGSRRGPSAAGALCAVDKAVTTVTLSRREKGAKETGRGKNHKPSEGRQRLQCVRHDADRNGRPRPAREDAAGRAGPYAAPSAAGWAGLGAQRRGPDSPRAKRASLPRTVY